MNAYDVRKALNRRFSDSRRYAVAEEVGLTTGGSRRRIDMIVIDCYWSNGFRIDGIEIKVSTADLRRELEDPDKHVAFFDKIDYFTLACPKGVVDPVLDIIPKKWGILIVNDDGTTRYKRKPLALEDKVNKPVSRGFFAEITRAIMTRQPSELELSERYKEGFEEGKKRAESRRDYMSRHIEEKAKDLEAYEKMMSRFRMWNPDDVDKAMDEFEAFRAIRVDWTIEKIERLIADLTALQMELTGKENER